MDASSGCTSSTEVPLAEPWVLADGHRHKITG